MNKFVTDWALPLVIGLPAGIALGHAGPWWDGFFWGFAGCWGAFHAIRFIEGKRWRKWAGAVLAIGLLAGNVYAEGGNGGGTERGGFGSGGIGENFERIGGRVALVVALGDIAIRAVHAIDQFTHTMLNEGTANMDQSGIQHAAAGEHMVGGQVVGDDGHIVGGI